MSITSSLTTSIGGEGNNIRRPVQKVHAGGNFATLMANQGNTKQASNLFAMPGAQNSLAAAKAALSMPNGAGGGNLLQQAGVHTERLQQAQINKQQLQTLQSLSQNMGKSDSLLDVARNDMGMRNMRTVMSTRNMGSPIVPMANSIKSQALAMQHTRGDKKMGMSTDNKNNSKASLDTDGLGNLSKKFESGRDGMAAIGYDRTGGTSYGSYQIASRVGSMENFLKIADREDPEIAKMLRDAGPANTWSRRGGMPDMWRKLAKEEPERLQALEKQFIHETHYLPAVKKIEANTDIDTKNLSKATQEVLFSTAVQHGPTGAARIFGRAAASSGDVDAENFEQRLISKVYDIRSGQFGSSTASVQAAVRNRMVEEKGLALGMLRQTDLA